MSTGDTSFHGGNTTNNTAMTGGDTTNNTKMYTGDTNTNTNTSMTGGDTNVRGGDTSMTGGSNSMKTGDTDVKLGVNTQIGMGDTTVTDGNTYTGVTTGATNVSTGDSNTKMTTGDSTVKGGDTTTKVTTGNTNNTNNNTATNLATDTNVNAASANKNAQHSNQTNAGNNSTNAGNNSSNAAQGNSTHVDASDRSSSTFVDKSRTIFIPPVVPSTPPSQVAIGNIIKETLACGPLQSVVKTPIIGTRSGIFSRSEVKQGFTYDLAPYTGEDGYMKTYHKFHNPDGSIDLFGHQVVMFTTVVGISGGGNIAIGGGSGNGDWGQGGFGNSSSNTRLVTNIQLAQCHVGTLRQQYVEVPVKVVAKKIGG
jgi:hypothetical protein